MNFLKIKLIRLTMNICINIYTLNGILGKKKTYIFKIGN